jgi:hypothetical protein
MKENSPGMVSESRQWRWRMLSIAHGLFEAYLPAGKKHFSVIVAAQIWKQRCPERLSYPDVARS